MVNNKLKEKLDEDELAQNYNLWINNKITDQQYFRAVNSIKK